MILCKYRVTKQTTAKYRLCKQNKNVYRAERKRMVNWTVVYFAKIHFSMFHLTTRGGRSVRSRNSFLYFNDRSFHTRIIQQVHLVDDEVNRQRYFKKSTDEIPGRRLRCIRHLSISAKVRESQYLRLKPVPPTSLQSLDPFSVASHASDFDINIDYLGYPDNPYRLKLPFVLVVPVTPSYSWTRSPCSFVVFHPVANLALVVRPSLHAGSLITRDDHEKFRAVCKSYTNDFNETISIERFHWQKDTRGPDHRPDEGLIRDRISFRQDFICQRGSKESWSMVTVCFETCAAVI